MNSIDFADIVLKELQATLTKVSSEETGKLASAILEADSIFVAGAGRSGLMGKAFAMRLMHMGLDSYVVGETITAGITSQGLLILCSGSGETKSLLAMAEKAKAIGAKVALLTIVPDSAIGRIADLIVSIPAATKEGGHGGSQSVQPMGSLFEQSLLLLLDALILDLMSQKKLTSGTMFGKHANLE
ncbi:6-phospho-3-hexuloisomerase [Paenibacillus sp. JX-17]|uniref:6-phospho-3-hexuloisomerase n=1 Tax=Paenibacillus lacisoli TaxID=3064525 RepID=A0ABT9C8S5_9BACL|nr:6-phospho-3-hexuloisomerase [Paenibacillus sp. JX-17]MDO7905661.1 6-phospho-3-hexuloisomerase [Paenibacillus sp. JX-17]